MNDPYFYARHDGHWVVKGPGPTIYGETVLDEPWLDKNIACIIAKLLSGNAAADAEIRRGCFVAAEDLLHSMVSITKP